MKRMKGRSKEREDVKGEPLVEGDVRGVTVEGSLRDRTGSLQYVKDKLRRTFNV
jgi:hypothetical protein